MIAWAGLIGLLIYGASYLTSTITGGIMMVQFGMSTSSVGLVSLLITVLFDVVLTAVCVKIADRLTAERRELVLSVVGWMIVAGFSMIGTIVDALTYGRIGVPYIVLTVLVNACLIAGTLLWLRERKAKA